MNLNKFKAKMALNGDTLLSLSEKLGISRNTLATKLNDGESKGFTQSEIKQLITLYNLSAEEIADIFFDD